MPPALAFVHKTGYLANRWLRPGRRHSRFKLGFIGGFAILFEGLLFLLFHDAFRFLDTFGGAGLLIIGRLFALFFLGLGIMLAVSSMVTAYAMYFSSDEIPFLLTRPVPTPLLVLYTFIQTAGYASWAFAFIVLPFIGAYAWHQRLSPLLVFWTLLASGPFLFLSTGLGTLAMLLVVSVLPRGAGTRRLLIVLALALPFLLLLAGGRPEAGGGASFNVAGFIPGLRLAGHPLSPSYWMAESAMALTRGGYSRGVRFLAALVSSAMLTGLMIERFGAWRFDKAWQRAAAARPVRRRAVLLPFLGRLRTFLPPDVAAMIAKDIRLFARDPVQWSQSLVFFGLLGIYIANLRTLNYHLLPDAWRSMIVFLNLFAIASVLSSLGSRFIFPQLSLEGHGFWLLGLSPASMPRILATKFLLASVSAAIISIALILLSLNRLGTGITLHMTAIPLMAAVSLSISGLSTGLGAVFMDLNQRNPAAIVSSFGGTLNIVLCLIYLLAVILPVGVLFHLRDVQALSPRAFGAGIALAAGWVLLLSAAVTAAPLALGLRALRRRDY